MDKDFNKYYLFASLNPSLGLQKLSERQKYLKFCNEVKSSHKTSGDQGLVQGSAKKEANIDNQFGYLCSYLFMDDSKEVKKAFEALCKTCGEKRFHLFGNKYSSSTASSQWLIQKLESNDEVVAKLRTALGIKDVKSTVEKIIASQNITSGKTAGFFQERHQTKSATSDKIAAPK